MITVTIAGMSVSVEQASEKWMAQMFEEGRKRGTLCVQVTISEPGAQVGLSHPPGCGGGGGGGRQANPREQTIIDAWNRRVSTGRFSPAYLRAFLQDVARIV